MVSNNLDKNGFGIDINGFNIGIRKLLRKQLQSICEISAAELNGFCIHMGIREASTKLGIKKTLEGPAFYFQSDNPKEKEQVIEFKEQDTEKLFLQLVGVQWPDSRNGKNTFVQKGVKTLTCGNIYSELFPINDNYDVLWAVCDKSGSDSVVHKLIMQVILYILTNAFRDINEIRAIGVSVSAEKVLNWWIKGTNFKFIDSYIEHLFKRYNLPNREDCERLALLPYEKRECKGKILLVNPRNFKEYSAAGEILFYEEAEKSSFYNTDFTRKMLEACNKDNYLLVSNTKQHNIIGFVKSKNTLSKYIMIEYKGVANWSIHFVNEEILCYKRGQYYISKKEYIKNNLSVLKKIKSDMLRDNKGIKDVYDEIKDFNPGVYDKIIDELEGVEHRALLIIALDAENEVERLCSKYGRGTRIKEVPMIGKNDETKTMITGLASVDGAVFMDLKGQCLAFGVILDGKAKIRGKSAQGSRHNSASNYIAGENRIAVIISEDKDKGIEILYGKR